MCPVAQDLGVRDDAHSRQIPLLYTIISRLESIHRHTAQQHYHHRARKEKSNPKPPPRISSPRHFREPPTERIPIPAIHTSMLRDSARASREAPRCRKGRRRRETVLSLSLSRCIQLSPLMSFPADKPAGCSMKTTAAGAAVGAGQQRAPAGRNTQQQHRRARLRDRPTRGDHPAVHHTGRGPSLEGLLVVAEVCPGMYALRGIPTQ